MSLIYNVLSNTSTIGNIYHSGSLTSVLSSNTIGSLVTSTSGSININSGQFFTASSGNVGINTSSPSYILDVNGTCRINNNTVQGIVLGNISGVGNSSVLIANSQGSLEIGIPGNGNANAFANGSVSGDIVMRTNSNIFIGTSATGGNLYLATSGNIGINSTSPAYTLDVNGNIHIAYGVKIDGALPNNLSTAANDYYNNNSVGSSWNLNSGAIGGTNYWSVYTGNRICATEFWLKSDARIKKNIVDISKH